MHKVGIIFALLYVGYLLVFAGYSREALYLSGTNCLFWWSLVGSIVLGVFMIGINVITMVIGGVVAQDSIGGKFAWLLGVGAGGFFALLATLRFLAGSALWVGGTWLLNSALTLTGVSYSWQLDRVFVGSLFLIAALFMSRERVTLKGSSSSSE